MRAVNLIPAEQRGSKRSLSTGLPFIGLVAGLIVVLAAMALFVLGHNRVDSRRSELAAVKAEAARWSAAAATYSHDVNEAKSRETTIGSVIGLAAERTNWSELLGQLATVMPAHSQIGSLTAAAPTTTAAAATPTTPTTSTTSTTASTTGTTSTTTAATSASAPTGSTIQLSGCAGSQSIVAATMVALRRVTGISHVYLSSSTDASGGLHGSGGGGGCTYPVAFSVSLAFDPPAPVVPAATTTGQLAGDTSTTSGTSGASQ